MSTTTDLIGLPSRSTTGMRNEIAILRTEVERLKVELGVQKVFTLAARKDRDEAEADLAAAREEISRLRSVLNCQGRKDDISKQMGAPFDEDLHHRMEAGHA